MIWLIAYVIAGVFGMMFTMEVVDEPPVDVRELARDVFVGAFIGLPLALFVLFCAVRYRRRPTPEGPPE